MIRQRVDRHGNIYPLEPASELPGCKMDPSDVGVIKEGPVRKWMKAKREWDTKFASAKRGVQKQRAREMAQGYQQFEGGEVPPPSALAGRRKMGEDLKEEKKKRSMGMSLWSLWGSKHDEKTITLEHEADKQPVTTVATSMDGAGARALLDTKTTQGHNLDKGKRPDFTSRSRSRRRTVTDEHQTEGFNDVDENTTASELLAMKRAKLGETGDGHLTPDFAARETVPSILVKVPTADESDLKRPKAGGIAYPFTIKGHSTTASMTTLTSSIGIPPAPDVRTNGVMDSGVNQNVADIEANTSTGNSSEEAKLAREKSRVKEGTPTVVKENGFAAASTSAEEKAVGDGQVVSTERPPLETFVTAVEKLPMSSAAS
jgi:hypothetical protein